MNPCCEGHRLCLDCVAPPISILTEVLVGEPVGLEQIDDRYWLVRFGPIELGRLDDHEKRIIQPSRKTWPA